MAGKPKPMSQIKQLLRLHSQGKSKKFIARSLAISKNTVKAYLDKVALTKMPVNALLALDDPELEKKFHPGNPAYKDDRFEVFKDQLAYFTSELKRVGVTRNLLWEEYRQKYPQGYGYTQFCHHLAQHLLASKPSMVLQHKAGEKLFIDFAGEKLSYVDVETGEIIPCQVFVACLPYSDYSFAMAVKSQCIEDFLFALGCCLKELGGVPRVLVTDNLKSAIVKADKYEPDVNRALEDFANHYNTTVIPTRVRKPKDKALVENQVKLVYTRVYARLRNRQFFDLPSLNQAIKEKVTDHNQTRMQQKPWCRQQRFVADEKHLLQPLPGQGFELKYYCELKVAKNNHIYLGRDKHYYSVPYTLTGVKVKVIYTRSMVRVYANGSLVATHIRSYSMGRYTTQKDHLCSHHRHYLDRSPQYYLQKAKAISDELYQLIQGLFKQNRHPEQLYRTCEGFLGLHRKTDAETFKKACLMGLQYQNYTYKFILNVINNKMTDQQQTQTQKPLPDHANIRGKTYYSQTALNFTAYETN